MIKTNASKSIHVDGYHTGQGEARITLSANGVGWSRTLTLKEAQELAFDLQKQILDLTVASEETTAP